jgi:hypothetical protein
MGALGLEPRTSVLSGPRSNQLSYAPNSALIIYFVKRSGKRFFKQQKSGRKDIPPFMVNTELIELSQYSN